MRERRSGCFATVSNSELDAARSTLLAVRQVYASAPIASSIVILGPFERLTSPRSPSLNS